MTSSIQDGRIKKTERECVDMETVVKQNTPDRIYQLIRKELIKLDLKPGQLISENDLSNTYNTSRTTIRSVLTRLKTDGLIVVIPKSGTYVTRLDIQQLEDLAYMRYLTELDVMMHLMNSMTPEIKIELEYNLNMQKIELEREPMDFTKFMELDEGFHKCCYKAAGREGVWNILNVFVANLLRVRMLDYKISGSVHTYFYRHNELYSTLLSRDVQALESNVEKHSYGLLYRAEKYRCGEYKEYFI